jgi:WD40 repeat protein
VDFFVSYTTADLGWAEWIAWQLEVAGFHVIIQVWDFVPGSHWMTRMADGVRDCDRVIALLSHAYLESVYGRKEWQAAFRADPDGAERKVIPIRVQNCPRPGLLDEVVSFDLFDLTAEQARAQLLEGIRAALAGRAKPRAEPNFPGGIVPRLPAGRGARRGPRFPGRSVTPDPAPPAGVDTQSASDQRTPGKRPVPPTSILAPEAPSPPETLEISEGSAPVPSIAGLSPADTGRGRSRVASSVGGAAWAGLARSSARARSLPGRRRVLVAASTAMILIAAGLVAFLPDHGHSTPPADPQGWSRQLAIAATNAAASDPVLAKRLAVAAFRTDPTPQARLSVLALLAGGDHPLAVLSGATGPVSAVEFSPNGSLVATDDSVDGGVRLWDTAVRGATNQPRATFTSPPASIDRWAFSPDGKSLATVDSDDDAVRLLDTTVRGTVSRPKATLTGPASAVAFGPDGKLLVTSGLNGSVRLWDIPIGGAVNQPQATLTMPATLASWATFSPDGKLLVTSSLGGAVRLWSTAVRGAVDRPQATLTMPATLASWATFSPDGKLLATYGGSVVRLWDTTVRGTATQPLAVLTGGMGPVAFSPNGQIVATVGEDHTVRLWDTTVRGTVNQPRAILAGHTGAVHAVAFSPNGGLVAAASEDHTVRLWDTTVRGTVNQPGAILTGDTGAVHAVAFSPNGGLVAAASDDHTARLWDVDVDRLVTGACANPAANQLTAAEWRHLLGDVPYHPPCS